MVFLATTCHEQMKQRRAERPKYRGGEGELCMPMPLQPDQCLHNYTERCRHAHVAPLSPSYTEPKLYRTLMSILPLHPQCPQPERHHLKHKAARRLLELKAAEGSLGMGTCWWSGGNAHQLLRGDCRGAGRGTVCRNTLVAGPMDCPQTNSEKTGRPHQLGHGGVTSKEAEVQQAHGYQEMRQLGALQGCNQDMISTPVP